MKTIVAIAKEEVWQKAQATGSYTQSTIDATLEDVGFIHCSDPEQTIATANRRFADRDETLTMLLIDTEKLKSPLKYESPLSGSAGLYPHVYGAINTDAVYGTAPLDKDIVTGLYIEPEELMLAMDSIACNIVITSESHLSQRAIELSRELAQNHETLFTLGDGAAPYPHVSVYMLQLKVADLPEAGKLLHDVGATIPRLELTATQYYQTHGYIDVEYERIKQLQDLQATVIEAFNPIRDGMREQDKARVAESTGEALENLEKYGWQSIGGLYRPHLTLTRFSDVQPIGTSSLPSFEELSGGYHSLVLHRMGDNGNCVRPIISVSLGSAA